MPRNKHPEVTRTRILDTAERLFYEKGYEHTTIQDIIDALGDLSKGAIYHHFKSKAEIIDAVTSRMYAQADLWNEANLDECPNGLEKLKGLCRASVNASYQEAVISMMPTIFDNPKILATHVRECFETVPKLLLPLIEEGNADGSLQIEHPAEMAGLVSVLLNIWVNPLLDYGSAEEYKNKFTFLQGVLEQLGLPILDGKILESLSRYVSQRQSD